MSQYLWETHLHTSETSKCATSSAAKMVRAYKDAGYHGIIITDHFLNGYTVAPRELPWQGKIDVMMRGYTAAKAAGDALGLAVLFGFEFSYMGGDFLTYGLTESFLRDQPDLADITVDDFAERAHAAGAFISQAHPFRSAWYMPPCVAKRVDIVDAIEVFNGSHCAESRHWDDDALKLALQHSLPHTAGSDAHNVADVATAALSFGEAFDSMDALIMAVKSGQGEVIRRV